MNHNHTVNEAPAERIVEEEKCDDKVLINEQQRKVSIIENQLVNAENEITACKSKNITDQFNAEVKRTTDVAAIEGNNTQQSNVNTLTNTSGLNSSTTNHQQSSGKVAANAVFSSLANLLIYTSSSESSDNDEEEEDDDEQTQEAGCDVIEESRSGAGSKDYNPAENSDSGSDTDVLCNADELYSSSDSDEEAITNIATKKDVVSKSKTLKTKGELGDHDLPPVPDLSKLSLNVHEQECVHMGTVTNIIDKIVMVESLPGVTPYDLDTLLFLDKGKRPLGQIYDVMGPVTSPLYAVRFNTEEEIKSQKITEGAAVYSAPKTEHTKFVFLPDLLKMKGTDASWSGDNEVPVEFIDFSDDEEEFRYMRSLHRTEAKRKVNSLERHKMFEKEMNKKNVAETAKHKDLRKRSRFSHHMFHYSQTEKHPHAFNHGLNRTQVAPVERSVMYPDYVYNFPPPSMYPISQHPGDVSLPINYMVPNPMQREFDYIASNFPLLFSTPPPPPPPAKEDRQQMNPQDTSNLHIPWPQSSSVLDQPPHIPSSSCHQQPQQNVERWPNKLP